MGAQGFDGFLLHLLIDLIEQTTDAAQSKVTKLLGQGKQLDERGFVQLQAKGVFGGAVLGAGGSLTQQRGQREAFTGGNFERGFGNVPAKMRAFADHAALFNDIEVFNRPVVRADDAVTGAIEAQLALLDQIGQVSIFHLVKRRKSLQKLHRAVNVLQHSCFSCLDKRFRFHHYRYRMLERCCYGGGTLARFYPSWSVASDAVPIGRKSRAVMAQ